MEELESWRLNGGDFLQIMVVLNADYLAIGVKIMLLEEQERARS